MANSVKSLKKDFLSYFDSHTLYKGEDYFHRKKVLSCQFVDPEPDDETGIIKIEGKVFGTSGKIYSTTLFVDGDNYEIYEASCSCPVDIDCKHAAALALECLEKDVLGDEYEQEVLSATILQDQLNVNMQSNAIIQTSPFKPVNKQIQKQFKRIAELAAQKNNIIQFEQNSSHGNFQAKNKLLYIVDEATWTTRPSIELAIVSLRKNGAYGRERPGRMSQLFDRKLPQYVLPEDIAIRDLWGTALKDSYYPSFDSRQAINNKLFALLFNHILQTGRCHLQTKDNPPLELGPELPGRIVWQTLSDGKLKLSLVAVNENQEHNCLRWRMPWYVDKANWQCGPTLLNVDPAILDTIFSMESISQDEAPSVVAILAELGLHDLIPTPPNTGALKLQVVSPVPCLQIETLKCKLPVYSNDITKTDDMVKVITLSTNFTRPADTLYVDESGKMVMEKHDHFAKQKFLSRLESLGFKQVPAIMFGKSPDTQSHFVFNRLEEWLEFDVNEISKLREEGWNIPEQTESQLLPVELDDNNLEFKVDDEDNWWFSLALNIVINGKKIPLLPVLMSAIRSLPVGDRLNVESIESLGKDGKFKALLPDCRIISLPFDRVRTILITLHELLNKDDNPKNLRMSILHASDLFSDEALLKARWLGGEKIIKLVERLRSLKSIEQVDPPESLQAKLRPYQQDGLNWLQFISKQEFGGILADDMGLGKTVQLLSHICMEKESGKLKNPFLVICPTSVLPNWVSETARFAPDLKVLAFAGLNRHASFNQIKKVDLVLSTYPLLLRDIEQLKKIIWHGIALDEAQAIKNSETKISQAACLLKANTRFCMTGTPVENHLGELWSQFQFLLPGLLGDQRTFNTCIRIPIEKEGNIGRRNVLVSRIRPFIMRRTKNEVAPDLPAKTTIIHKVELDADQRDLYETVRLTMTKKVRDEIAKKGFKQSQIMILDALLKLRQVCCDPRLVKTLSAAKKINQSAKLQAFVEMIKELYEEGRKVLVFSQFTSMLDLIVNELTRSNISFVQLRGDTRDRKTPVDKFQNGDVPIFLISLKAGGTGLNLTAADTVIHYDPWWNPAVEDQATDRAHRIGQIKNVFVYKLIAQGTIEERMLELQKRKRKIANSIYDDKGNLSLSFSESDLESLLRPIDALS